MEPTSQRPSLPSLRRRTPIAGDGPRLHGASGLIRRAAYQIPEHKASHFMLLMLADRVDVVESALGARKWLLLPLVPASFLLVRRLRRRR